MGGGRRKPGAKLVRNGSWRKKKKKEVKEKKEERKGWKLLVVTGGLLSGFVGAVLQTVIARKKLVRQSRNIGKRLLEKPLVETEHASCRMSCRFINKKDVRKALEQGTINKKKSDPRAAPHPKIAFDDGRVRAVFSDHPKETRIVTVIDRETDHICPPC